MGDILVHYGINLVWR